MRLRDDYKYFLLKLMHIMCLCVGMCACVWVPLRHQICWSYRWISAS